MLLCEVQQWVGQYLNFFTSCRQGIMNNLEEDNLLKFSLTCVIFFTVILVAMGIYPIIKCEKIKSWPKIEASFNKGWFDSGDTAPDRIRLNVSYKFHDKNYENVIISYYYGIPFENAALNIKFLSNISPGSTISLFVNPDEPTEAYVETHNNVFYHGLIPDIIVILVFLIYPTYYCRHKFISLYKKIKELR